MWGCSPAPEKVEVDTTIVSLNPCADAILAEVARPEQLLAISHYSHNPRATSMPLEQALQFATTGGTAEEVIALQPDVVVADIFLPPATKRALERAGIEVVQIGGVASREDSYAMIDQLTQVSGGVIEGAILKAEIEMTWGMAGGHYEPVSALLWQEGGIVPGEKTLAAAMLEQTGFTLHSASRGLGQGTYLPLEAVLSDPPDVILASGEERMLTHPVLRELEDVRYETFDSGLLYCGGRTIIHALERLREIREATGTPLPPAGESSPTSPLPLAGGAGGGPDQQNLRDTRPPLTPPASGRGT